MQTRLVQPLTLALSQLPNPMNVEVETMAELYKAGRTGLRTAAVEQN